MRPSAAALSWRMSRRTFDRVALRHVLIIRRVQRLASPNGVAWLPSTLAAETHFKESADRGNVRAPGGSAGTSVDREPVVLRWQGR
jgi:hypothetical protein